MSQINIVHKNSQQLLTLINQLLDFRKVETNNWTFRVCYDNLSEKIKDIGNSFIKTNSNPNVKIILEIEEDIKEYFDSKIIDIILNNLLSNAIKYTKKGHVTLFCKKVELNRSMFVEIGVKDTGTGISKKELKHIFDRYYQGESAQRVSGTGIGLSMVKTLSDIHEMTIKVESQLGKGSTFAVSMCMDNTYPSAEHYEIPNSDSEIEEDSYISNIIVNAYNFENDADTTSLPVIIAIDDNEEITSYIAKSLSDDYQVITASNGIQGIRLVLKAIPDLVICDIMMPFTDGFEVCERMKRDFRTCHIPIMLLTAKDADDDKAQGYDVGADSYITKPFSGELLRSRVKNLIDARKKLARHLAAKDFGKEPITEENTISEQTTGIQPLDEKFMQKLTGFIKEGIFLHEVDVNSLANKMCMSPSTMYRKIKSLIGISTNEYVRKIRIREAAELLKTGQYNVSEAAWQVDMNNMAYFRNCFKEEFGVSPSTYRKQYFSKENKLQ